MSTASGTAVHEHSHSHDHGHSHDHDHDHDHGHSHVVEVAPQGGPIVLDIGGDIGALIVRLDDDLAGTELPIESLGNPSLDKHTGVWRRPLGSSSVVVAVYPDLVEGRYRLSTARGPAKEVDVTGGEVSELDLRSIVS